METVTLYRVMCDAEFVQLVVTRRFLIGTGNVEGKFFAETIEDAEAWGRWFHARTGVVHDRIVAVQLSREQINGMCRFPMLDGIGPAVFASPGELPEPADIEIIR